MASSLEWTYLLFDSLGYHCKGGHFTHAASFLILLENMPPGPCSALYCTVLYCTVLYCTVSPGAGPPGPRTATTWRCWPVGGAAGGSGTQQPRPPPRPGTVRVLSCTSLYCTHCTVLHCTPRSQQRRTSNFLELPGTAPLLFSLLAQFL